MEYKTKSCWDVTTTHSSLTRTHVQPIYFCCYVYAYSQICTQIVDLKVVRVNIKDRESKTLKDSSNSSSALVCRIYRLSSNLFLFYIPLIVTSLCSLPVPISDSYSFLFIPSISLIQILLSCLARQKSSFWELPTSNIFILFTVRGFLLWKFSSLLLNLYTCIYNWLWPVFYFVHPFVLTKFSCSFFTLAIVGIGSSSCKSLTSILSVCLSKSYLSHFLKHCWFEWSYQYLHIFTVCQTWF